MPGYGQAAARFLTQSAGHGAAVGAGIGALAGGLRSPQDGQSRLGGALHGAIRGGVAGGVVGGVGSGVRGALRDTRLLAGNPAMSMGQAVRGTLQRTRTDLANVGRRQWYGLTGRGNPNAIGVAGNATAEKNVHLMNLRRNHELGLARNPAAQSAIHQNYNAQIAAERKAGREAQVYQDANITNLPGIAKGLATPGKRTQALKAMRSTFGNSKMMMAGTIGLPAVAGAYDLSRGDETATGGLNKRQKLRNLGLGVGTGALFGGMPLGAQLVAGMGTDALLAAKAKGQRFSTPPGLAYAREQVAQ